MHERRTQAKRRAEYARLVESGFKGAEEALDAAYYSVYNRVVVEDHKARRAEDPTVDRDSYWCPVAREKREALDASWKEELKKFPPMSADASPNQWAETLEGMRAFAAKYP